MPNAAAYITRALADEVRGAARREGYSQAEIAEQSGLSLTTVQRLLAGKRDMDATQLTLIANVIGEKPAELLRAATTRAERMSEAAPDNVTPLRDWTAEAIDADSSSKRAAHHRDAESDVDETD